jgi:hypothetical protein
VLAVLELEIEGTRIAPAQLSARDGAIALGRAAKP